MVIETHYIETTEQLTDLLDRTVGPVRISAPDGSRIEIHQPRTVRLVAGRAILANYAPRGTAVNRAPGGTAVNYADGGTSFNWAPGGTAVNHADGGRAVNWVDDGDDAV